MKFITRYSDYAFQSLMFISKEVRKGKKNLFIVPDVAKKLKLPHAHLRRIFQKLAKKSILRSYKGGGGGFSLNKKFGKVTMNDIINTFQGPIDLTNCYIEKRPCPRRKSCNIRKKLLIIGNRIVKEFKKVIIC